MAELLNKNTLYVVWLGAAELAEFLAYRCNERHGRVGGAECGVAQDPGGLQAGLVEGARTERTWRRSGRRGGRGGPSPGSAGWTVPHSRCGRPP